LMFIDICTDSPADTVLSKADVRQTSVVEVDSCGMHSVY
jgi:hypothetical protein